MVNLCKNWSQQVPWSEPSEEADYNVKEAVRKKTTAALQYGVMTPQQYIN